MWTNWRQGVQGSVVFLEFIICPSGISRCPFPLFLRVHRSSSRCEGEARDFSTLMRDFVSERMILYIQRRQSKKEFSTISSSIGIIIVSVLVLSHVEFGSINSFLVLFFITSFLFCFLFLWGGGVFSTIYKVAVGWCVRTTRR